MKKFVSIVFLFLVCVALLCAPGYAQQIQLQHKFTPGQKAKSETAIKLQGNTLVGGEQAKTNLNIHMLKHFNIGQVDASGAADVTLILDRIKTQGTMNNERFNQDLTGDSLKNVMFGMTKEDLKISPQGYVQGNDDLSSLSNLGISLPASPSSFGGFEFPTFPSDPVQIGSEWTESGMLIGNRQAGQAEFKDGTGVYKLERITSSRFGRAAVIHYKKTTDLSGMGLGSLQGANSGLQGISTGSTVSGLVISLEGEILFLIDQGVIWKTTQKGYWNLNMGTQSTQHPKRTNVEQRGMKINIQSVYTWTRSAVPAQQQPQQEQPRFQQPVRQPQQPLIIPPKIQPPIINTRKGDNP